MGWSIAIDGVVVVLVVLLLPAICLFVRRRWLARQGGMFDCAFRSVSANSGWTLGMARYKGEFLEWFPVFSFAFRPRIRLRQTATDMSGTRDLREEEREVVFGSTRVAQVTATADFGDTRDFELAMDNDSITGLMAWLEAAPPSLGRFIN